MWFVVPRAGRALFIFGGGTRAGAPAPQGFYSVICSAEFLAYPSKMLGLPVRGLYLRQRAGLLAWQPSCCYKGKHLLEAPMMTNIHVDKVGEMAVVECEGRFVRSEEAFKLRDAVTAQRHAHVIVLDLTEMRAIGGGGVGVLVFLQRWCRDHDIRFKLFNPSRSVQERLENTNAMSEFDFASLDEMMALLGQNDRRYALAS